MADFDPNQNVTDLGIANMYTTDPNVLYQAYPGYGTGTTSVNPIDYASIDPSLVAVNTPEAAAYQGLYTLGGSYDPNYAIPATSTPVVSANAQMTPPGLFGGHRGEHHGGHHGRHHGGHHGGRPPYGYYNPNINFYPYPDPMPPTSTDDPCYNVSLQPVIPV